jgi:glycosyltransferase involved in cell wall biosynthesis
MKNVLMLGWELPPFNSGGLGVACFFMAEALSKKINLVFALPKKLSLSNTPFPVIFADDEIKILSGYLDAGEAASGLLKEVESYGKRLERLIKNKNLKFDLIHAHDWLSASAAIYLKNKFKIPAIIHIHATEIERTGNNPNLAIFQKEKENFDKAERLITVSHQTREIVYQYYNIARDKISVVPNGIELKINPVKLPEYLKRLKADGYKLVLFVGRLSLQKGPDYFLETLPLVKQYTDLHGFRHGLTRNTKIKYIFCGSGEMMERLINRASELNVLQDIIFTGFLRNEELWGMYQLADVFVAPSVFDPFGLVPLESIKYNTPVIISKTTGVGDYLYNVLKVDFWDINKMAGLIIATLKYSALRRELTGNSFQELPKFDWNQRADKIIDIYQSM